MDKFIKIASSIAILSVMLFGLAEYRIRKIISRD